MREVDAVALDYRGPLISTNAAYKKTRWGSFYMSREGKQFKTDLAFMASQAMRGTKRFAKPIPLTVELNITFPSRRSDIDGPVKLILDAMNKIVWDDDKQVWDLTVRKHIASKVTDTGVYIEVRRSDAKLPEE